MRQVLKRRMLESQRLELKKRLKAETDRQNQRRMENFMSQLQALGAQKLQAALEMSGTLLVKKDAKSFMTRRWKRRWCAIKDGKLIQYYSERDDREVFVIFLDGAEVVTTGERIDGKDNCFQLLANRWVKKGKMFSSVIEKRFHLRTKGHPGGQTAVGNHAVVRDTGCNASEELSKTWKVAHVRGRRPEMVPSRGGGGSHCIGRGGRRTGRGGNLGYRWSRCVLSSSGDQSESR